jgi:4-amino-4-deoxychorismate lyase
MLLFMDILFNGNLLEGPLPWSPNDRAFMYGDGFFETMMFANGSIPLKDFHFDRIQRAASIYKFDLPMYEFHFLEENIQTLAQVNELSSEVIRAKLMIWRRASDQEGYRTGEHRINWVLLVSNHERPFIRQGLKVAYSESVVLPVVPWAGVKSINALPYVLASLECDERKLDDLIIKNTSGIPAEGIASNLFWKAGGKWYTPADETGCIRGTMRAYISNRFVENALVYWNQPMPEEVPEAAFLSNALGIGIIAEWNGYAIADCIGEVEELVKPLISPFGGG